MTIEKKKSYIIIDDHPFFRDGVKNYLDLNSPFECIGEFSQTRPLINSETYMRPDFILLDLNLPGLGGEISCSRLKEKFPLCKIIALTQYSNLQETLMKLEFDGYIEKDNSNDLLDAIKIVLEGNTYFPRNHEATESRDLSEDPSDSFSKRNKPSKRELEIMGYVIEGLSNPQIAKKLFLSEYTVKTHRKNFYQKTGVRKIRDLIKFMESHHGVVYT
jgi:DNA-binding NarL/FixJ family response regulator